MAVLSLDQAAPLLRAQHRAGRLIPFLGAGFSMPLKLPSWGELMDWMAKRLGFEGELFGLHGTYQQLAEFFDAESPSNLSSLIYEMTIRFDSAEIQARRAESPTHRALAAVGWRTIYTTNYDAHIEGALLDAGKACVTLASLEDFQTDRDPRACEVIKFHGTLSRPETIVLTESSYFERMKLEGAADQRLRADLLSHGFLFLGYSFSDPNIRYVWYRMNQMRKTRSLPRRCYFATFGVDPVQPALLDHWNIDVIALDPTDKSASVTELLARLQ